MVLFDVGVAGAATTALCDTCEGSNDCTLYEDDGFVIPVCKQCHEAAPWAYLNDADYATWWAAEHPHLNLDGSPKDPDGPRRLNP